MNIVIEALFDSPTIERAILYFSSDNVLFNDILDFMGNHKSDEYVCLSVDEGYVKVFSGAYNTVRKMTKLPEIQENLYTNELSLPQRYYHDLLNTKIYANRHSFYFYGDYNGETYQSYDITRDIIKQWMMEVANV